MNFKKHNLILIVSFLFASSFLGAQCIGGLNANGPIQISGIGTCTPDLGMIQWNTSNNQVEWWDGAMWQPFGSNKNSCTRSIHELQTANIDSHLINEQLEARIQALEEDKKRIMQRLEKMERELRKLKP